MIIDLIMIIKLIFVNNEDPLVSSHKECIKDGRDVHIELSFLVGLAETLPLRFFFVQLRKVTILANVCALVSVTRGTTNLREVYHEVQLTHVSVPQGTTSYAQVYHRVQLAR